MSKYENIPLQKPSVAAGVEIPDNVMIEVLDLHKNDRAAGIKLAQNNNCGWRACYNGVAPIFRENRELRPHQGGGFAPRMDQLPPPRNSEPSGPRWTPNPNNLRRWEDKSDYCRIPIENWKDPQNYEYLCGRRR